MTVEEERRQNCVKYQGIVDDLKDSVYDKKDGLVMVVSRQEGKIDKINAKLSIFIVLQTLTLSAIASASIKIIITGGIIK